VINQGEVLVDFTTPEATLENLSMVASHGLAMVIGTTGLSPEQIRRIEEASREIPIVFSSNMSVGVNILFKLVHTAAQKTGETI